MPFGRQSRLTLGGLALCFACVFSYAFHTVKADRIGFVGMHLIAKCSIHQPHAKAYGAHRVTHGVSLLFSKLSMKRDKESRGVPSMNVQWGGRPSILRKRGKFIGRFAANEFDPSICNNAVSWKPPTIGNLHVHEYPFSSDSFSEGIPRKFGYSQSGAQRFSLKGDAVSHGVRGVASRYSLVGYGDERQKEGAHADTVGPTENEEKKIPTWRVALVFLALIGCWLGIRSSGSNRTTRALAIE